MDKDKVILTQANAARFAKECRDFADKLYEMMGTMPKASDHYLASGLYPQTYELMHQAGLLAGRFFVIASKDPSES